MARGRNKRKQRRRGRFGLLYKLLSSILILCAIFAGCVVFFRVEHVKVTGNSRYTQKEIITASGVKNGDNLILINKYRTARVILSGLPYVDEIIIRRGLPNTLHISVSECTPVACLADGEDWWIMDAKGKLLEKGGQALAEGYTVVKGLTPLYPSVGTKLAAGEENSDRLQSLIGLLGALYERGMTGKVDDVDVSGVPSLLLGYDGRFTVELPMRADFSRKVWQLEEVVKLLSLNESGYLDLTGERGYFRPER